MMTDAEHAALVASKGQIYADIVRHNERRRAAAAARVQASLRRSGEPAWADDERDAKRQADR
jgi:hypothetical protein